MMFFKITHATRYSYSVPVFLEPLTVRLRPRCDAAQHVHSYNLKVTPTPRGVSRCVGLDGNGTETVWFEGLHDHVLIETISLVETLREDPFDFLVTDPAALALPLHYGPHLQAPLAHYLERPQASAAVTEFAQGIAKEVKGETIPFLMLLTSRIQQSFKYSVREHGDPYAPEQTLAHRRGACRDLAVLFIDICRERGIAARFVSGYCYGDAASEKHLHAWAEVYLPGAGWRGFDPSQGLATGDSHIALAAGRSADDVAPTFGHYRGEAASSLTAQIDIHAVRDASGINDT